MNERKLQHCLHIFFSRVCAVSVFQFFIFLPDWSVASGCHVLFAGNLCAGWRSWHPLASPAVHSASASPKHPKVSRQEKGRGRGKKRERHQRSNPVEAFIKKWKLISCQSLLPLTLHNALHLLHDDFFFFIYFFAAFCLAVCDAISVLLLLHFLLGFY